MDVSSGSKSRRRGVLRRAGAAGLALAAVLVLGACRADGGGYIGEPLRRRPGQRLRRRRKLRLQLHLPDGQPGSGRDQGQDHLPRQRRQHGRRSRLPGDPAQRHRGSHLRHGRLHLRGGGREPSRMRPSSRAPTGPRARRPVSPAARETAGSWSRCSTRVSRAARGRSPGTASPSNSSGAPTPPTPGAATSRAGTSR